MIKKWLSLSSVILFVCNFLLVHPSVDAATLGMVADNAYKGVTVFDAESNEIRGTVLIPRERPYPGITGDCVISPDQKLGFLSDFQFRVWVIDLESDPPVLASGINPISIGNNAEDLVMTPDGKYLIACDGGLDQPVVLIDVASRQQVSQYNIGGTCNAVDVTSNGSILAASADLQEIHRLEIDETGLAPELVHSGYLLEYGANNVYSTPDGQYGIAVRVSGEVISFSTADMLPIDASFVIGDASMSGEISTDGTKIYVRSINLGNLTGYVTVFDLDPLTGLLGDEPSLVFPVAGAPPNVSADRIFIYFGIDQLALSPDNSVVYVPERDQITLYDAVTGAPLEEIGSDYSYIRGATGIDIQGLAPAEENSIDVLVDVKPGAEINSVSLRGKGRLPVAVLGSQLLSVSELDVASLVIGDPLLAESVGAVKTSYEDVNFDGYEDLVILFDLGEMVSSGAIDQSSGFLLLSGSTLNGVAIIGADSVRIVGKPPK